MGIFDNMSEATNRAVERMKQERAAKEAAAKDAEKRMQYRGANGPGTVQWPRV